MNDDLARAYDLLQAGEKQPAEELLTGLVQREPDNEYAWLGLARLAASAERRAFCLQQVLRINPHNMAAQAELRGLQSAPARRGLPAWVSLAGLALLAGVLALVALQLKARALPSTARQAAAAFLAQAAQLDELTTSGVDYTGYQAQLQAVNQAYAALGPSLPPVLQPGQAAAEQALQGWNLALDLWTFSVNHSQQPFLSSSGYAEALAAYTGGQANCGLVDECVVLLFNRAGEQFASVKQLWSAVIE